MKTIKFLVAWVVRDARQHTPQAERYEAGQVVSLSDASAQHWLNRGKAVEVEDVPPPPEPVPVFESVPPREDVPEEPRPPRRGPVRKDLKS